MLLPFGVCVAIFTFFALVDRIFQLADLIITRGVPAGMILGLLGLMLPAFLTFTLPMALLVATILASSRMTTDLEVVALSAAGASPLRLLRPLLLMAIVISALVACITTVINPWTYRATELQLARILQSRAVAGIQERTFTTGFPNATLYVDSLEGREGLDGVLLADDRDPRRSRIILAREGRIIGDGALNQITVRLVDGEITEREGPSPAPLRRIGFGALDVQLEVESPESVLRRLERREYDLPVLALFRGSERPLRVRDPAAWLRATRIEIHKRFALPIVPIAFVLIGFGLGIRLRRPGIGGSLVAGMMVVVTYYVLFSASEQLAMAGRLPLGPAIWLANAVFLILGGRLVLDARRACTFRDVDGWGWLRGRLGTPAPRRAPAPASPPVACRGRWLRGWRVGTVDRYLLTEFAKCLGIGLGIALAVFSVVDLLRTLDRTAYMRSEVGQTFCLFLYRVPAFLQQVLPIVVLGATVVLFLKLGRHRELDAFKAAGVSVHRISLPVLTVAVGISLGALALQESLLPDVNRWAREAEQLLKGRAAREREALGSGEWYRIDGRRYLRVGNSSKTTAPTPVDRAVLVEVDDRFRLVARVDARDAVLVPEGWTLRDGVRHDAALRQAVGFASAPLVLPDGPTQYALQHRRPAEMTFLEMRTYLDTRRQQGRTVGPLVVELYAKLSTVFVHPIMVLVAIPFAVATGTSRGLGLGISVLISIGYWLVHAVSLSFGKADLLPPLLAAWVANLISLGFGSVRYFRLPT